MALFKKKKPEPVRVEGFDLRCEICKHDLFWHRQAQLNTAAASFFTLCYIDGEDHATVMSETYRVLRPGGHFHIWDANNDIELNTNATLVKGDQHVNSASYGHISILSMLEWLQGILCFFNCSRTFTEP